MPRHTNKLLKVLLEDQTKLDVFTTLVNSLGSANKVKEYFHKNKFFEEKYYLSSQTISNIMRKLGFKGTRGRPSTRCRYTSKRYNRV